MTKVKAKDSFHLSGIGAFKTGDEADVSNLQAKELEKAGLVTIIGEVDLVPNNDGAGDLVDQKGMRAPENKMMPESSIGNKGNKAQKGNKGKKA